MSKKQQKFIEIKNDVAKYFDSFCVKNIPKEFITIINNGVIKPNNYRIQAYYSIMCEYFCSVYVNFILRNKRLSVFTNSFLINNSKESDQKYIHFFNNFCVKCNKYRKFKTLIIIYFY